MGRPPEIEVNGEPRRYVLISPRMHDDPAIEAAGAEAVGVWSKLCSCIARIQQPVVARCEAERFARGNLQHLDRLVEVGLIKPHKLGYEVEMRLVRFPKKVK